MFTQTIRPLDLRDSVNNQLASNDAISSTPNGSVKVLVNGISHLAGALTNDCYFSRDSGITAQNAGTINAGDFLYWNADIAGFALSADDNLELSFRPL